MENVQSTKHNFPQNKITTSIQPPLHSHHLYNSCVCQVENLWTANSVSTKFCHLMAAFHRAVAITGSRQQPVLECVCGWVRGNRELLKTTITSYNYIITSISIQCFTQSVLRVRLCMCVCVRLSDVWCFGSSLMCCICSENGTVQVV